MYKRTLQFLVILFSSLVLPAQAQDVILKKDGEKILCRITGEDSLSLYYSRSKKGIHYEIPRSAVAAYTMTSANNQSSDKVSAGYDLLFIGFQAGVATPLGVFGSRDVDDELSGLAGRGFALSPGLILKLNENIGITASHKTLSHRFLHELLAEQLNSIYRTTVFRTRGGRWKVNGFTGGIYLSFPVKRIRDFNLHFQADAGFLNAVMPRIEITGPGVGGMITVTQHEARSRAFAFSAGLGFDYKIGKNVALLFNLNYLRTQPKFTNILTTVSSVGFLGYDDYTQLIESLNLQLGLAFVIPGQSGKEKSP